MCAQAEMLSIQIIEGIQDTSMALSKYRLLICRAEPPDNDGELSRRFFRRIRKNLYAILEMENLSDEDRSTASRLMLRLNKLDPKKAASPKGQGSPYGTAQSPTEDERFRSGGAATNNKQQDRSMEKSDKGE